MQEKLWLESRGAGPVMATAIHAGHELRGELVPLLALDEATRAHEEDPYTDYWVRVVPTWIVPQRSRFEVDLNRPRDEAVYREPEMAWGLNVWQHPPDAKTMRHSLEEYDAFYCELREVLDTLSGKYRHFAVFDLHAYNYRRAGPHAPAADPEENPEVNVGTGSLNRQLYGRLVERFIQDLRSFNFLERRLDVRENVKFKGRHLAHWIHQQYPNSACVLSIEFKKFYMNEWTGVGDIEQITAIRAALQSTVVGVLEELDKIGRMDVGE